MNYPNASSRSCKARPNIRQPQFEWPYKYFDRSDATRAGLISNPGNVIVWVKSPCYLPASVRRDLYIGSKHIEDPGTETAITAQGSRQLPNENRSVAGKAIPEVIQRQLGKT